MDENIYSNENKILNLEYDFFILFRAFELSNEIYKNLSNYKIMNSYSALRDFIDDLNNFYIRANRDRFWKSGISEDKERAFNVLYSILYYLAISIAPILPFFAENIFSKINDSNKKSVHLEKFIFTEDNQALLNKFSEFKNKNNDFLYSMQILKKIFYHGRSIRDDKLGIRMRQPLKECKIITNITKINKNFDFFKKEICRELNFHDAIFIDENNNKESIENFFSRKIKLNTRLLGPKLGKKIQEMKSMIDSGSYSLENNILKVNENSFEEGEFFSKIHLVDDIKENSSIVHNEFGEYALLWINSEINNELSHEGMMRDLVRSIQDARKTTLEIADRIDLYVWSENSDVYEICKKFENYICEQTLSRKFEYKNFKNNESSEKEFEESLIKNGFCIFGYNIHDTYNHLDINLKLAFKK